MSETLEILETIAEQIEAGHRAALCAIVATRGSTPQPAGTIVCVDESGKMTGTLGGGCVEADVRTRAADILREDETGVLEFELDFETGLDEGMICGGRMDVAVCTFSTAAQAVMLRDISSEIRKDHSAVLRLQVSAPGGPTEYRIRLSALPKLVIAGGGHVGRLVAEMMVPLGFHVSVVDDRVEFANAERFAPPINPVAGEIASTLAEWPIDANTYIVIVTRGHKHDQRALAAVLNSPAKYIGMIGSRRKFKVIFKDLIEEGASREQIDRVCAPIGLDINSVTAREIALSIAAQLVSVRRANQEPIVEGPIRGVKAIT